MMKTKWRLAAVLLALQWSQGLSAATLPELISQLGDRDAGVRKQAAATIPSVAQPDDFTAISALNSVMGDSFEEPLARGTAAYALCLIILGFRYRAIEFRYVSFVVMGATVAKIMLIDLATTDPAVRVGVLDVLSVVGLRVSDDRKRVEMLGLVGRVGGRHARTP